MKFFLPHATDAEMAETGWAAIKAFASVSTGWQVEDHRIYRMEFVHDGQRYAAEVGQVTAFNHEEVIAILSSTTYLVCTANRGVIQGLPILVGHERASRVEYFE